jgi:programmed cell death protein 5
MSPPNSDDLEEIRKRKMQELLQQQLEQQSREQMQQQLQEEYINVQIKKIINQILTPKARERLGNIRTVRPDFARSVELFLIQLYQAGRLPKQLNDAKFKEILLKLKQGKKEINIRRE